MKKKMTRKLVLQDKDVPARKSMAAKGGALNAYNTAKPTESLSLNFTKIEFR